MLCISIIRMVFWRVASIEWISPLAILGLLSLWVGPRLWLRLLFAWRSLDRRGEGLRSTMHICSTAMQYQSVTCSNSIAANALSSRLFRVGDSGSPVEILFTPCEIAITAPNVLNDRFLSCVLRRKLCTSLPSAMQRQNQQASRCGNLMVCVKDTSISTVRGIDSPPGTSRRIKSIEQPHGRWICSKEKIKEIE